MKVSIVIPTRERAEYLRYSIQAALAIEDQNVEILISDNCSQDDTRNVVEAFDDPRIVYFNTGKRVSMRENCNAAIQHTSGEYVILFGDDDGILPKQFTYLKQILESKRPDGVSWIRGTYGWPEDADNKKLGGMRMRKSGLFGAPYTYDPKETGLDNLFNCDFPDVPVVTPNIYHGCVSKAYIEKIATEPSVFLNSVIPDINFEYRAIMAGGDFVHVDHMFTISGYSKKSTGGAQKGYSENDEKSGPAKIFNKENATDPFIDLLNNASFVPLAFFATLETARLRMNFTEKEPDFLAWYQYVLSRAKKQRHPYENVLKVLRDYSSKNGTEAMLDEALQNPITKKRSLHVQFGRIKEVLSSYRFNTQSGSENTILTAANVCDELLGELYSKVHNRQMSRSKAWHETRKRCKRR